jgi:hypothetical protein
MLYQTIPTYSISTRIILNVHSTFEASPSEFSLVNSSRIEDVAMHLYVDKLDSFSSADRRKVAR